MKKQLQKFSDFMFLDFKYRVHLFLTSLSLFTFSLIILNSTFEYYVLNKYFEGFAVIGQVLVLDIILILIAIFYMLYKDFLNLLYLFIFFISITFIGLLGFKISLILLPISSTIGSYIFLKLRSKKQKTNITG